MMYKCQHIIRVLLLILQTFAITSVASISAVSVSVDPDQKFQQIDGFGASDCWSFQKIGAWSEPQKNLVADLLFSVESGIGLSQWRFNIGGGVNNTTISNPWRTVETFEVSAGVYDWSRQAEERWFLEAAQERGVQDFIAFVNSPPGRMTRNGLTNCTDGQGSTNLKSGWENQFARYLKDILVQFKDVWGIEFNYISPVNEPQWEWNNGSNQEGNRASNIDIRNITLALYDTLQSAGLSTEISLVESGDLRSWYEYNGGMTNKYNASYGNYLTELIAHPHLTDKISKHIGGHSYWSDRVNTQLVQDRESLEYRLANFLEQGWSYWVTEYTILDGPLGLGGNGRDLTMTTALDVARVIHFDLTLLNASSWQWWTAVSPENYKDGLIYTDYRSNPAIESVIESKLLWTLGNFSRFIRPGYKRVSLDGADNKFGLMGSAYLSGGGDRLVAVFINVADGAKEVDLQIATSGWSEVGSAYLTSDTAGDDLRQLSPVDLNEPVIIPPESVLTLVIDQASEKPPFEGFDPELYQLYQNYPNPFNGETNLAFNLPESGGARLAIYSLNGRMVHSIEWQHVGQGINTYAWDGRGTDQLQSPSGIYLYTLEAGSEVQARKMIYIE